MRACGLTGPNKFKHTPTMEYWSGPTEAIDRLTDLRFKNDGLLPYNCMVYRSSGENAVGVFLDMPNPNYRSEIALILSLGATLQKCYATKIPNNVEDMRNHISYINDIVSNAMNNIEIKRFLAEYGTV